MTDNHPARWTRRRFMGGAFGLATLGTFASACGGGSGGPSAGAAPTVGAASAGGSAAPTPSGAGASAGARAADVVDADLLRQRYGLTPFAPAPAAPATKPIQLDPQRPQTFSSIPTSEKICFVTIDDGIDKDPAFIQMVKDVKIPITISLADTLIRDDYAYFEQLYQTGYVSIEHSAECTIRVWTRRRTPSPRRCMRPGKISQACNSRSWPACPTSRSAVSVRSSASTSPRPFRSTRPV